MALVGINVDETIKYVPKCEEGAEKPTTFVIGVLKNKDKLLMGGSVYNAADKGMRTAEMAWEMVKKCVRRIENFIDPKTQECKTYTDINDDVLCMLGTEIILEVAEKIAQFNKFSTEEEKN